MAKEKAYKFGAPDEPDFPADFEIVKKAVLQVTDIKTNRNKYYAIELHRAGGRFRVFTHYGRTDDLETNPNAGQRETRFFTALSAAQAGYESIYREKTSPRKGYKELALASSRIGSQKAIGTSAGEMDAKTVAKLAAKEQQAGKPPPPKPVLDIPPPVQDLVRWVYSEATDALTSTVAAKITAHGIETPLGVLTIGQIEKGEAILGELYGEFQRSKPSHDKMVDLSGEFYTLIPHRIGRTRAAVAEAVIDTLPEFEQKQETLQLMKDMLQVNGESGSVLFEEHVGDQYSALGCTVGFLDPGSGPYKEIEQYVLASQIKHKNVRVKNIYTLKRAEEWSRFNDKVGNERLMFHGSRLRNWVGLLSRGILLPKIVVSMGVNRTDAGWLGNGIYFGDAACTAAFYTTPGTQRKTRLMALARVALGKMKDFHKITYGLNCPPAGFDSCHGVRRQKAVQSQFDDDEYVIYDACQQRLEYLVEFTM